MDELNPQTDRQIVVHIEDEMRGAYLDYAMSVIIGRALPDVRDGLKPVHRRVLYAMHDLGNTWNKAYKKSARVVGDVIGKYHPHGDSAVYDTMVRMAQDFSMRYPLIDGQGNFGSIDGDSAAAMRYTEVRMSKITDELLEEIEKETVDFGPNYDDSLREPLLLPAKFPNLLINGSSGIAVGMATNIPPHNLREVIDATIALIANPSLKVEDLMNYIKGPDFPTGGAIMGGPGIKSAYLTGKGVITIRGKAEIETMKGDRERIIITELPYQVNKAKLIERVADLVKEKKIDGISDLRDESDRTGMRVVIDVKKGDSGNILLNRLYSLTQLQDSFGITLLAIHNQQPKVFNLRDMIWAFVEHRKDVVTRRTLFDLRKAEARAHILEGLKRAVENLDAVIQLIKSSPNPNDALQGLMRQFSFSEKQGQAILDMRLQRLTGLERDKIIADYEAILKEIAELRSILADESKVMRIVSEELADIRERFGDDRRTQLMFESATDFEVEDLINDEETLVTITHSGYIKRADPAQFRTQGRGGRGVKGMTTQEGDFVTNLYSTTTLTSLLCFTDKGRMHRLKVFRVPEASRVAKGKAIVNLISIAAEEKVRAILPVKEFSENEFVVMVTRNGIIKKTALSEFKNVRSSGINAISIEDNDQLIAAKLTNGASEILLSTAEGMGIRFPEANVRPMGRNAYGVNGMSLDEGDRVVGMSVLRADDPEAKEILIVTEKGYGKRTPIADYRLQSRGGKGVITMKIIEKNGRVVAAVQARMKEDLMLVSDRGQMIRTRVGEISEQGRAAQGVRVMTLEEGEKVVAVEPMAESAVDAEENGAMGSGLDS